MNSYDEGYSAPTEPASLVSLRTQQIIQEETAVTEVIDPLSGSFYVESLTNDMERRIIDEIEVNGGIVTAIEKGWLRSKIAEYAHRENKMIEEAKIIIVGHNYPQTTGANIPEIDVFRYPEYVAERQRQKLGMLRSKRDNERVVHSLQLLQKACTQGENVFPYCLEAARTNATEGEIADAFRTSFGMWKPHIYW